MDNTMVLNAGFNELVFENRHKKYGAYEIRRRYRRNVILSGLLATSIFAAGMILYVTNAPVALAKDPPGFEIEPVPMPFEPPKPEDPKPIQSRAVVDPAPKGPDVKMPTVPVVTMDSVKHETPNDSMGMSMKGKPGGTGTQVPVDTSSCIDCDTIGTTPPPIVEWAEKQPLCDLLDAFFQKNIRYPQQAKEAGIEGTVYLEFVVGMAGEISEVRIAGSAHPLLDREVLRVSANMPMCEPATNNGRPVKFRYRKPVSFKLSK